MHKLFEIIPYIENERLVLKKLEKEDADALDRLRGSKKVYRYLPTFLFEQKYEDIHKVLDGMYGECIDNRESIILGIFLKDGMVFTGLAEIYGVRDEIHKASIGYRLLEEYWGQGIATETVSLLIGYLYKETDTEIITASTMVDNKASARVLTKNGFLMSVAAADEDWGYGTPTKADKWFV